MKIIYNYKTPGCTMRATGILFSEGSHNCQAATQHITNPSTAPHLILDSNSKN